MLILFFACMLAFLPLWFAATALADIFVDGPLAALVGIIIVLVFYYLLGRFLFRLGRPARDPKPAAKRDDSDFLNHYNV